MSHCGKWWVKKLLMGVILLLWSQGAMAAIPGKIVYQGFLKQSGMPVSGSVPITVRLYDAPGGGTLKMTCASGGITITAGKFFFEVGETVGPYNCDVTLNNGAIDLSQPLYVELEVNATVMTPREQLLPSAMTLKAAALGVSFSASGAIAATHTQGAIEELDTEKLSLSGGTLTGILTMSATLADALLYVEQAGGGPVVRFVNTNPGATAPIVILDSNHTGEMFRIKNSGTDRFVVNSTGGVTVSQNLSVSGDITANLFYGNGSQLSGVLTSQGGAINGSTAGPQGVLDVEQGGGGPIARFRQGAADKFVVQNNGGVSASGGISASGGVSATQFFGDGSQLTGVLNGQGGVISGNTVGAVSPLDIDQTNTGRLLNVKQGGAEKFVIHNNGAVSMSQNLSVSGDVTANYFYGDGTTLTGLITQQGGSIAGSTVGGVAPFAVDQSNTGTLLQLKQVGVDKFVVQNNGAVSMSAGLSVRGELTS